MEFIPKDQLTFAADGTLILGEICAEGPSIVEVQAQVSIRKVRKPAPALNLPALKVNSAKIILRVDGQTVAESFHQQGPKDDIYSINWQGEIDQEADIEVEV